ncbi:MULTISPECIES: Ger(x)C family spore germination protein [Oceanobacillus]|uniref:Spore germination protein A3 n=2 Tax=Oceanobacillus TaxID=182709 RepID=A0A0A1MHR1_9BACI|nr:MULTISPECIES: Ger(x)C family spore germination protein [Oceanobacillus]UUI04265.1 Ger(x)C family spore germination protein [Oceanobacillus jeddahense]GIO19306.1 germination protein GerLC [Oceanobacillus oncorhynchi subsp. incaldanensis]CEI82628.1 Spore germination protein A3 precursor [Oceanobacillus oncorhynchi]
MNKAYLFLLGCFCLLLAGCWDEVNIEERGFVIGVALDLAEEQSGDKPIITMTDQFVVPSGLGTPSEGGNNAETPYNNLSISGQSLFKITREMALIQGNPPFYEHLKLIVVSEELAREPEMFANSMDLLIRDHEMRRETKVIISDQKAKELLEIESQIEPLPAMHIDRVNENMDKSGALIEPLRIGNLNEYMLEKNNYLIPRVVPSDGKMMFNGAGVFDGKTNQLVDVISGLEIVAVNLITGDLKGGYIEFESNDGEMVYEIKRAKSNIEMNIDETGKLNIDIEIDTEGYIAEVFSDNSLLSKEYFNELDKLISERMEKITSNIIKKAQEDIGMDFFGFRKMMEERHYKEWLKVKDNWDEGENIFQNASINVTVDATVRATGTVDQTRD